MPMTLPGTAIPYDERAGNDTFALISPIISATGGISLSQLSALTGLEGSTIQNWIKRGWAAPSTGKKYGERSVVRILLINILKSALKLEDIARLMEYVNGEVMNTEDDILHDTPLYNLLCSLIYESEQKHLLTDGELREAIKQKLPQELSAYEKNVLENVLLIMIRSALAGYYRSLAQSEFLRIDMKSRGKKMKI